MRPITICDKDPAEHIVHLLTDEEEWSVRFALAANRPLLVQGEPGIGKSQLAQAMAVDLNRPLVSLTIDSRTESQDLLWRFDAVERLAEAQVYSNVYRDEKDIVRLKKRIAVRRFIRPGPLWWALNWMSAAKQLSSGETSPELPTIGQWDPSQGVVVLIDEIDKGHTDVPNGLLEAFGLRQFTPRGFSRPVKADADTAAPLVIVTTNQERMLPDPFIRRCIVLSMKLPNIDDSDKKNDKGKSSDEEFLSYVVERGKLHFPTACESLVQTAATFLLEDRRAAIEQRISPKPGLAEFMDLLRAVTNINDSEHDPEKLMGILRQYAFSKGKVSD